MRDQAPAKSWIAVNELVELELAAGADGRWAASRINTLVRDQLFEASDEITTDASSEYEIAALAKVAYLLVCKDGDLR
ncbi:hypothetical protein JCM9533A_23020 [Catenuloplanes niger JCM 9533]|uniref:Uncharacterized protein n=1 Tax=Catenuloplanes niger TaxID=587534 RepID=A0AAE3ZVD8_9ACTN|nr:hypothetical protein [Catenuloplanes niger]